MITSDLITQVYYAYRGKGASKVPVWGSEKSNTALAIANRKKDEWAKDSNNSWSSNFRYTSPYETGTVSTSGTTLTGIGTYFTDYKVNDTVTVGSETRIIASITSDTSLQVTVAFTSSLSGVNFIHTTIIESTVSEYSLHRRVFVPSDKAIVHTNQDNYLNFSRVQERNQDLYVYGANPKKVVFVGGMTLFPSLVTGNLIVPAYYIPKDMVNETDIVEVDDPYWLVYATASELARNDPAKEDQFATLQGLANELYIRMSKANRDIGFNQANSVPMNMPIIGDYTCDGGL